MHKDLQAFFLNHTTRKQLWIGYSGGLDSTVLLHQVLQAFSEKKDYEIRALHIHHGLQVVADQWVLHCEKVCQRLAVPFKVLYVDAKSKADQSPEEAAREARLKAFKDYLKLQDVLLLAHHEQDQA